MRNIIEQCIEWQNKIIINFVDFEKAFDSLNRDNIWEIMKSYGIPDKIINIIKIFYNNYRCSVLHNGTQSSWFTVQSEVRQFKFASFLLFFSPIVIDWCIRRTIGNNSTGIRWSMNTFLEDLDFADELCFLSTNRLNMQEKTSKLQETALSVGLKINVAKTKVMSMHDKSSKTPITLNGDNILEVEDFTYLGTIINQDNGTTKDILARINKVRIAFCQLRPILKSTSLSRIRIYNSNVKSVLLYGAEC